MAISVTGGRTLAAGRLSYAYYTNNLLKDTVSSNANGLNLGYRYGEANRLEFVDDTSTGLPTRTTGYTYNANGSLATATAPNGVVHTYAYDSLNRLRSLAVTLNLTPLRAYSYALRAGGHRHQTIEGARTVTYTYDGAYRLTGETITADPAAKNGALGYTLDQVGNRSARTSTLGAIGAQSGLTFNARDWQSGDSYDSNGNTITGQLADLAARGNDVYDFENRLVLRTKADGSTVSVNFDADGNRIGKYILNASAQPVSSTAWLVDTNNPTGYAQVLEERITSASGAILRVYTYGSSLINQTTSLNGQAATLAYYAADGHGNTRELTDASGTVTDRYDYDAFGILTFKSGVTENAYRYCGEQYDGDLGLYYLRARYLNTDSGRFWSMDGYEGQSGDPVSLHKYLYAHADGVNKWDPSGNVTLSQVMATVSIVGTIASIAIPTIQSGGDPEVFWDSVQGAIPIYGSGSSAVANFQAGSYVAGAFDVAITVADIFTAKAAGASARALAAGKKVIPGARGVINGGSSSALASSLGGARTGFQAHHLIPTAVAQRSQLLKKVGINLDHFSNGIMMPAAERHSGFHSVYSNAVEITLRNIESRNLPLRDAEVLVMKLQGRLRGMLLEGMPLYDKQGARIEDWLKYLNDGL